MIFIDHRSDLINTLQYINEFTKSIGIALPCVDPAIVSAIIQGAVQDGLYQKGCSEQASPFRKTASFLSYFVANRPILVSFSEEKIGPDLCRIKNHENAIVGLEIAIDSLHGAKIHRNDGDFILENKIKLSKHSYVDIIDALHNIAPANDMKMVAVLLEQMAYRQNPSCEYKP